MHDDDKNKIRTATKCDHYNKNNMIERLVKINVSVGKQLCY